MRPDPRPRPLGDTLAAMGRGFRLRCPVCTTGRMPRSFFGVGGTCPSCGTDFELGSGDFSGAIMIAQMLMGLLVIPIWIALTLVTPWSFTWRVVGTFVVLLVLLLFFYRNIKGLWYGFLLSADGRTLAAGDARTGAVDASEPSVRAGRR